MKDACHFSNRYCFFKTTVKRASQISLYLEAPSHYIIELTRNLIRF